MQCIKTSQWQIFVRIIFYESCNFQWIPMIEIRFIVITFTNWLTRSLQWSISNRFSMRNIRNFMDKLMLRVSWFERWTRRTVDGSVDTCVGAWIISFLTFNGISMLAEVKTYLQTRWELAMQRHLQIIYSHSISLTRMLPLFELHLLFRSQLITVQNHATITCLMGNGASSVCINYLFSFLLSIDVE